MTARNYFMKSFSKIINLEENQRICVINMPVVYRGELAEIPEGVMVTTRPLGKFDKVILFTNTSDELQKSFERLVSVLNPNGVFIICYPDKKSGIYTEIKKSTVEEISLEKKGEVNREFKILSGWKGISINF
jgi:hypothetical protein